MPRQARLDAPGILHHVMVRGIEQGKIVDGRKDGQDKAYVLSAVSRISAQKDS